MFQSSVFQSLSDEMTCNFPFVIAVCVYSSSEKIGHCSEIKLELLGLCTILKISNHHIHFQRVTVLPGERFIVALGKIGSQGSEK